MISRSELTIGGLAAAAGVNVETIRYYQRIGLLAKPMKPVTGFRRYPVHCIARVRFIKHAQQLGFSLKEIEELLDLGDGHCGDVMGIAEQKYRQIQQQIEDLTRIRQVLGELIEHCRAKPDDHCGCPIIDTISDPPRPDDPAD